MTDGELLNRLEEIDEKVDKIQSDVNINTSMHKELNKEELRNQIMTKTYPVINKQKKTDQDS